MWGLTMSATQQAFHTIINIGDVPNFPYWLQRCDRLFCEQEAITEYACRAAEVVDMGGGVAVCRADFNYADADFPQHVYEEICGMAHSGMYDLCDIRSQFINIAMDYRRPRNQRKDG